MKKLALVAVLAALSFGASVANAKDAVNSKAAVRTLARVPAAEMPVVAAQLVSGASAEDKAAVATALVRRVAQSHPVALRHVVASIAKADPSLAAVVAGAAAKANPEGVASIVTAACNAAPDQAAEIIAVSSRSTSASHVQLAQWVADVNPVFSAAALAQRSSEIEVSADASSPTGGTVIYGPINTTLGGDTVTTPPTSAGPGTPGFDPDRYAGAGS